MTSTTKSTNKYWMIFGVSVLATIAFLMFKPEWFWVMLPFVGTSLVYALDWV